MEGLDSGKRQSSAEKARLILGLRPQHDLATLLQVAQLPRSTFYYHCAMAQAGDKYAQLKEQIATIFAQHKQRYGYRRVHAQLRNLGEQVNHKLVQRLMQELGLKSPVRRKKYNSWRGNLHVAAPNVLARRFKANQEKLISGDIIKVAEIVRDLWRREQDRGLSAGEKRMLTRARRVLVDELSLAQHTDDEKADTMLDEILAEAS